MNDHFLKDALSGEEWMALRQIASGGKAAAIPASVCSKLMVLGLVSKDDYGRLTLTRSGQRILE